MDSQSHGGWAGLLTCECLIAWALFQQESLSDLTRKTPLVPGHCVLTDGAYPKATFVFMSTPMCLQNVFLELGVMNHTVLLTRFGCSTKSRCNKAEEIMEMQCMCARVTETLHVCRMQTPIWQTRDGS